MPDRALLVVALLPAPLLAQTPWSTVPIAPVEQVHRPSVALGDVDGDGIQDLVLGKNGAIVVRRGSRKAPDRRFDEREQSLPGTVRHMPAASVGPSCESAGQPRLADVDRDGDLDVIAIDSDLGGDAHIVWFANDGGGTFAPALALPMANGKALRANLRTIDLADVDRDGDLDLLIGSNRLSLHLGGPEGFATDGLELDTQCRGAAVLVDWDGDAMLDVICASDEAIVLRRASGIGAFAAPERLVDVEGGSELVQLAVADWDGDGRPDLLLGDNVRPQAPAASATPPEEVRARRRAAQRVLDVVQQEVERLNATKPPLGDPTAKKERDAWRDQLARWAEGPRALLAAQQPGDATTFGGRLRALVRR